MTNSKININLSGFRNAVINYLVPLVCMVITVVVGFFVLRPSYKALPGLKSDLDTKRTLESNLNKKLGILNKLVDFKSVVDENSNLVNKILVSEEMVPALLTQADKIATESGLQVTKLSYTLASVGSASGDEKDTSSYKIVEISMGVGGGFEQFKTFLLNLESASRMINVNTLRYTYDTGDNTTEYAITLVLHSPYLYVESTAVTDDPVDLDITSTDFINLINKIKSFRYYDPNEINVNVEIIETPSPEAAPVDTPPTEN